MKKSLIAAATLAAITLGTASMASAAGVGTGLGGVRAHAETQIAEKAYYKHRWNHGRHHKQRVCKWRHHHRVCWWR